MQHELIFMADKTLTKKDKSGDFRIIELHDPVSLEKVSFFVEPSQIIDTTGIVFKDKVKVTYGNIIRFGRPQTILEKLEKVKF